LNTADPLNSNRRLMMSTTTLPMAPPSEPLSDGNTDGHQRREAVIRASVLKSLGRPDHLFRVAVMLLWGNNYRVNVVTGMDASSVRIPNSYYVVADDHGNILQSAPEIRKEY
jgi:hypothetical protein